MCSIVIKELIRTEKKEVKKVFKISDQEIIEIVHGQLIGKDISLYEDFDDQMLIMDQVDLLVLQRLTTRNQKPEEEEWTKLRGHVYKLAD